MTIHMDEAETALAPMPELEGDLKENRYFATQIFSYTLPEDRASAFNARLIRDIRDERTRDRDGIQRSNFQSLGGWHSRNTLHEDPRFAELVTLIDACSATLSEKNDYHPAYRLAIGTMWAISNPPGSFNRAHIHPNSQWSGVYYVQAPEGAGNIDFTDPRTQNLMRPPQHRPNHKRPRVCWTKVNYTPEAGKLLLFPSWLYHSVAPNLATHKDEAAERIIVSFNLSQKKHPTGDERAAEAPAIERSSAG